MTPNSAKNLTESQVSEPKLYTSEEVIKILRLYVGHRRPEEALRHLRRLGRIGFVKYAGRIFYREDHVARFIEAHSVEVGS